MIRILCAAAIAVSVFSSPMFITSASAAEEVAGLPALPTTTTEELIAMRDKWGTAPSK